MALAVSEQEETAAKTSFVLYREEKQSIHRAEVDVTQTQGCIS